MDRDVSVTSAQLWLAESLFVAIIAASDLIVCNEEVI